MCSVSVSWSFVHVYIFSYDKFLRYSSFGLSSHICRFLQFDLKKEISLHMHSWFSHHLINVLFYLICRKHSASHLLLKFTHTVEWCSSNQGCRGLMEPVCSACNVTDPELRPTSTTLQADSKQDCSLYWSVFTLETWGNKVIKMSVCALMREKPWVFYVLLMDTIVPQMHKGNEGAANWEK